MNVTVVLSGQTGEARPAERFLREEPARGREPQAENGDTLLITALRKQRWGNCGLSAGLWCRCAPAELS